MSFKTLLRTNYDSGAVSLANSYGRCLEKLAKFRNHIVFSARCKKTGLIPPSLQIKSPVATERGKAIASRASRQFLNERLRVANYKVRQLEDELKWTELGLRRKLNTDDFTRLDKISKDHAQRTFIRVREHQKEKFERFALRTPSSQKGQPSTIKTIDRSRWVINKSSRQLTNGEQSVLQRGLNFAQNSRTLHKSEIIAGVEPALRKCKNTIAAEHARSLIASVMRNCKPLQSNITTQERQAIRSLKKDKELMILPADKGNATVVLDTTDYIDRANTILNNPPFKRVMKNPTTKNEKRINDTLKRLADKRSISKQLHESLRVPINGTRPPLFYGSVKIHKEHFPLRPIVSAIGSATYPMAKYVSRVLTPYVRGASSYIANTADFVQKLAEITIEEDETMVSFDVKSLFTNVPRKDAFQTISEIVTSDTTFSKSNELQSSAFLEILRVCLATTSFQFRDKHYELTDGLPMGSPASPTVANIFMAKLEEKALDTFKHRPKAWYRFVDDVFAVIKKRLVQELLTHLNAQHTSITFTVEHEEKGKLPFMDTLVHRIEGRLETSVYRKPTHTGRYLQFSSNHPDSAKRSVVDALFRRLNYVSLSEDEKQREERRIRMELSANGYPSTFVQKTLKRKKKKTQVDAGDGQQREGTACIPYVRGMSEQLQRILARVNIRTVMKPNKWKWKLMHHAKDVIPPLQDPGVVYALGCGDCNKVYVGETTRTAKQRTREHKCHTNAGHPELSAIAEHVHNTGHSMHWEAHIVAKEQSTTKRKVKEALIIHQIGREKTLNHNNGLELSKLWLDVIKP